MQLIQIDNLATANKHLPALIEMCNQAEIENLPANVNMAASNWQINNASLLYLLLEEKRFMDPNGCLHVVYEETNMVACSGVYISDFSSDVVIAGVRAYTLQGSRTKYIHGNTIFPTQIKWAKNKGAKVLLLTFNAYNDRLYKFIIRGAQGKATAFGLGFSDTYKKFIAHNKQVIIKSVPQYILKLSLEEGYEYDFRSIECN